MVLDVSATLDTIDHSIMLDRFLKWLGVSVVLYIGLNCTCKTGTVSVIMNLTIWKSLVEFHMRLFYLTSTCSLWLRLWNVIKSIIVMQMTHVSVNQCQLMTAAPLVCSVKELIKSMGGCVRNDYN